MDWNQFVPTRYKRAVDMVAAFRDAVDSYESNITFAPLGIIFAWNDLVQFCGRTLEDEKNRAKFIKQKLLAKTFFTLTPRRLVIVARALNEYNPQLYMFLMMEPVIVTEIEK